MCKKLFLFPIILLSLLTGCTNSISTFSAPDLNEKGIVLLSVTDRGLFASTGVIFSVEANQTKERLVVKDFPIALPTQAKVKKFFGAFALPEGNYKFTSYRFIQTAGTPIKEPNEPLTFTVKKGEIVYIGNFDVTRFLESGIFRDKYDEDITTFKSEYSWLNGLNIKKELIQPVWWSSEEGKKMREKMEKSQNK
ncbi:MULTISPECIES: hypothetical protein [Mannheimia]|uniref:Lipoprotein n=1 Tax=Mannheimia bovis TaxID=2770636 RepID=A0A7H1C2S0_9PAST|nr:hypothetical protein [Mannheimia bovis]QNS15275.1 hypothetical protein ICJ55_00515 [Mannheimia bovis]